MEKVSKIFNTKKYFVKFLKNKKASKYADCKSPGKESLLKYYGVKTERRVYVDSKIGMKSQLEG